MIPVVAFGLFALAFFTRGLLTLPEVAAFVNRYPGIVAPVQPAPVGIPAWLNWQHFLNILFLALIARTALEIRSKKRPPNFVTRRNTGLLHTKGNPRRMSIHVWLHIAVDILWVVNGVVFIVLLFGSGQWLRIVPTSWEIIPNAVSAGLQYLAWEWPAQNSWVIYNSLQVVAYFVTVFVAAPMALLTGWRLSHAYPQTVTAARVLPERPIRWLHNATLAYFLVFTIVHVGLVVSTGFLHNLNMMFAANDGYGWNGLIVLFLGFDGIMAIWMILRPKTVAALARLYGKVQ